MKATIYVLLLLIAAISTSRDLNNSAGVFRQECCFNGNITLMRHTPPLILQCTPISTVCYGEQYVFTAYHDTLFTKIGSTMCEQ